MTQAELISLLESLGADVFFISNSKHYILLR